MNAVEIIEQIRAAGADITVEGDRLVVLVRASPLPDELKQVVREHKPELMVALGAPMDRTIAAVLNDIRPHLPASMRWLSNDKLLVLVNWTIMAAWQKVVREAEATAR